MYSEPLHKGLQRQFAIVFALVVREMTTRYGNKFGGYMWAVLDPVLTIAILTLVFSGIAHVPPLGRSFTLFFATGYAAFYMYRSTSDQVASAIDANRALLNYPVVRPYDAVIGRIVLQVATLFVVNLLLFGGLWFVVPFEQIDLGPILLASLIAIVLGAGVGASNIVWFHLSSTYQQVWGIINRPAFIISGVFFLPDTVPHPFREYLLWNPLVHVVGLFRTGFYPTYRANYVDMPYIVGLAVFSIVFGLFLIWLFDAKLRESK
ncbi:MULTISPECIES: ABC transporter permease [Stappiaceae]|uniref:Putative cell surface polysaccharide export ABC-2 transporter permease protein, close relative to wzm1Y20833 n=1 Tax=Roseibium aggregatum (strain ATCC 25650 / DSM 13394 / JCM 20685 / NBRC 16684 / NCIMB 2208 / IAM 12614 / B1) TaxID=384765 RepID=A0P1Z8_ROSAI|nr:MULTISPECIES: ABC transporter permease [Stappiaceae]EAV40854.1 putative cell surface polysaccharide export ABC-2 transporter permease protein, close relative to wzm1Y20833 [Stappia aggregata IAM 12614] [Roseibium aggregatum IAM 12614]